MYAYESKGAPTPQAGLQQEAARRMAQRQMALQVASVRERLEWFAPFLLSSATFLLLGYRKTRSSVVLYPLVPMCFALGYQVDFAFGNKTNRIKSESVPVNMF